MMDPVALADQMRAGFRDVSGACKTFRDQLIVDGFTREEAVQLVETWLGASIVTAPDRRRWEEEE